VAKQNILADGTIRDVAFDVKIERSSWVALRILPSSHTNPIFVLVEGKPIRASRRSAEWCLRGVDQCWSQKERHIRPAELEMPNRRTNTPASPTAKSWVNAIWTSRHQPVVKRENLAATDLKSNEMAGRPWN